MNSILNRSVRSLAIGIALSTASCSTNSNSTPKHPDAISPTAEVQPSTHVDYEVTTTVPCVVEQERVEVDSKAPASGDLDPLFDHIPRQVQQAVTTRFPSHRIWQFSRIGEGELSKFELTVFDPKSRTTCCKEIKPALVCKVASFNLEVTANGDVLYEESHVISEGSVPVPVRDAFQKWSRGLARGTVVWTAHQQKGAQRLYSAQCLVSSVEDYDATFNVEGAIIQAHVSPKKTGSGTDPHF